MSVLTQPHYHDETKAYEFVEGHLWAKGRVCPFCGVVDNSVKLKGKTTRIGLYKCRACRKPFTVKIGTIFEASHVPLHLWLQAIALMSSSKKGISANQLHRTLGITLKSAWFLSHRIREAMNPASDAGPLGGEGKIVEADETELSPSRKTRKPRSRAGNMKFVSLIERGGHARSRKITGARVPLGIEVRRALHEHLHPDSILHTDGAQHYKFTLPAGQHEAVDHNKTYVRKGKHGKVHTNTAEGYFSLFKRGLVGTYQHIGEQHLPRYLAEFDFRYNNRLALGIDDEARAVNMLKGFKGKRLTYRTTNRQMNAAVQ